MSNSKADYEQIFEVRGELYNSAATLCPTARDVERYRAIDELDIEDGDVIVDIPAGGGYVIDGILEKADTSTVKKNITLLAIEPSDSFAKALIEKYNSDDRVIRLKSLQHNFYNLLPEEFKANNENNDDSNAESTTNNNSIKKKEQRLISKICSLAGLHHCSDEEKSKFFEQCFKALNHKGKLVVADVLKGSNISKWLNEAVDKLTKTGHDGYFFTEGEFTDYLTTAGFTNIKESYETYHWTFDNKHQLLTFCNLLFGLENATSLQDIESHLLKYFDIINLDNGKCAIEWGLLYASATKA